MVVKRTLPLVLGSALISAACYNGPPAAHMVEMLDDLEPPNGWDIARTSVRDPDDGSCSPFVSVECPAATRYFVSDADTDVAEAFAQARSTITEAGFSVDSEATSGCDTGTPNGRPCSLIAKRGEDRLYAQIFYSPSAAGVLEGYGREATTIVVKATSSK